MERRDPMHVRCWVGLEGRALGVGAQAEHGEVEVPTDDWPTMAGQADVLAVLREGTLDVRDGLTGELRSSRSTPFASGIRASSHQFWLDEDVRARPVSFEGAEGDPVDLLSGNSLVAASTRWLATRKREAFDNSTVVVVSTSGSKGRVFSTPSLANPGAVAFTVDGLVVAHDGGISRWTLDGRTSEVMHRAPQRLGLVTIVALEGPDTQRFDADWLLLCEDVQSETTTAAGAARTISPFSSRFAPPEFTPVSSIGETTQPRLVRFRHGKSTDERMFTERAVGLAVAADHLWVLTSKSTPQNLYGPIGPVQCRVLDSDLNEVDLIDFGKSDWRGGFAVCARPRS